MLAPVSVTVVVNGSILPSSIPVRITSGRVVAPLAPIVSALARSISIDLGAGVVTIERSDRRITVPIAFVAENQPFLVVAPIVRALGGSVQFDRSSKTLAIAMHDPGDIATPAPFDPREPQVAPTTIFTPEPPKPTPRAIETGPPIPRRTAIPAIPSQPVIVR